MKTNSSTTVMLAVTILTMLFAFGASGQTWEEKQSTKVQLTERNMGGPRMGMTYLAPKSGGLMELGMKRDGIGNVVSQFGWHFEYQVVPQGGGPQFLVEFVPLIGGVEYGVLLPSMTLGLGIRFPEGIEFGLGPNILIGVPSTTALMMTVGKSFNYGGVSIPVNLVWVRNDLGSRFSLIFGYAIER